MEACRILARLAESEASQVKAEARSEEARESLDKGSEAAQGEPERLATLVATSVILGGFGGEIVSSGLARSCAASWKDGRWRMLVLCASAASQVLSLLPLMDMCA